MSGHAATKVRPDRDAHRAAGQAVAATLLGAPLTRVSVAGVEIGWSGTEDDRPRLDIIGDALVGLTGLAARSKYSFGDPDPNGLVDRRPADDSESHDWNLVRKLLNMVDPDDEQDLLFLLWRYALDLTMADDV